MAALLALVLGGTLTAGGIGGKILGILDATHVIRDVPGSKSAPAVASAIFQFDGDEMRLKDLQRLGGLQMNAAAEGKAGFCAGGNIEHNAVECFQGDFTHGVPRRGLHQGTFTFAIPGLEDEVNGKWVGKIDDEVADAFDKLYGRLDGKERKTKETADMMKMLMQA